MLSIKMACSGCFRKILPFDMEKCQNDAYVRTPVSNCVRLYVRTQENDDCAHDRKNVTEGEVDQTNEND